MKKILFFLAILLASFVTAPAQQTGTVRGFVYEKETGETVNFTYVKLTGTKLYAQTDVNGYFSITNVPPGNYTLMITFVGCDTLYDKITVKGNDIVSKKYFLAKKTKELKGVEISAEKLEKTTEVKISVTTITPKEIKQLPTVGGEPDFAQYVQVLPGVVFTGDQGGQLYIRGGSPIQNKVLLDGMIVYNPFHSIGLFSVFDTDIIKNVDVYTGGFNAEFGGRISSVMDITTRDGNKKRMSGKISFSPFGAKGMLEGPLKKQVEGNEADEGAKNKIRSEIDALSSDVTALNKNSRNLDSLRGIQAAEKAKISANLQKIIADTNFKEMAAAVNAQLKTLQHKIDSLTRSMNDTKVTIEQKNISINNKNKELEELNNRTGGGSSSYILSAKTSYLDQSSKILYPYVNKDSSGKSLGLPFTFNDYYGKLSFNSTSGSKLNLFGFNFNDKVSYQALSKLNWTSWGGGGHFVLVPAASRVLIDGTFAYSKYGITMTTASDTLPRHSDINGFNMITNFTYFNGENELKYGVEILGFGTNFEFYNPLHRLIQQEQSTTEIAGYFKYKMILFKKKLVLEPSIREQYYASLRNFSHEPRLGFKLNAFEKLRFKFAGGFYGQNLMSASSDRDVVNLFYGFLSGPENLPETFTDENGHVKDVTSHLQKAWHAIGGLEYDLTNRIDINIEAYIKRFTQLTNLNRNKYFDDDADHADFPDQLKKDYIIETGNATGLDVVAKYDYKRFYFWAVYSLAYVNRWDGAVTYVPHFDRRHNINLVTSYTFGKNLDWEVDCRWNFGSGFPFTQTAGFYEQVGFNGSISSDYATENGGLGILYGQLNAGRLPYYHRLDLTIKKKIATGENSILEISGGATNVYNRANIFYFDRIKGDRVNQLPIMPFIAANWSF